jgi:odorant receptor
LSSIKNWSINSMKSKEIVRIINKLDELMPNSNAEQEEYQVCEIYNQMKWKTNIYYYLNLSTIILYNFRPIVSIIIAYLMTGTFERTLPTPIWVWFDYQQPIIYEITYFIVAISGFAVSFIILGTDLLFCSIATLLQLQFKIIAQDLRKMKIENIKETEEMLRKVNEHHQKILELSNEVNEIFAPSFLGNIILSTFVICMTGFQAFAAQGRSFVDLIHFAVLLCPAVLEIFLLCYFAENVNDAALDVADAAYDFPWYEKIPFSMRKTILQIIHTSQQGKKFKAFKFRDMSLETCSEV